MAYTILHNSRCSKSRAGLDILQHSGQDFEERFYLEQPLNLEELQQLQSKLWLKAIEFTRRWEADFKIAWLDVDSSDAEILEAIAKFPKLLERPIVYNETQAVIWRPPENILDLLK